MGWRERWSRKKESWRFNYLPRIVDLLVAGSTYRAKRRIGRKPFDILIDNSVLGHSITHETGWVSTGPKKWGHFEFDSGYAARVCVYGPGETSDVFKNVTFIPGIAHLARKGLVKLCTSAELLDEQFRQPVGRFHGYGSFDYGLFRGLRFESVDGQLLPEIGPSWMKLPSVAEQQQTRLANSNDALYLALLQRLGGKNNLDAWHIRTAERHNLFCFLTMDFALIRAWKANAHLEPFRSLSTRVMTPMELGQHLGLIPVNPIVFSYHDANWFVRSDLHWRERRRRPRSLYKKSEP